MFPGTLISLDWNLQTTFSYFSSLLQAHLQCIRSPQLSAPVWHLPCNICSIQCCRQLFHPPITQCHIAALVYWQHPVVPIYRHPVQPSIQCYPATQHSVLSSIKLNLLATASIVWKKSMFGKSRQVCPASRSLYNVNVKGKKQKKTEMERTSEHKFQEDQCWTTWVQEQQLPCAATCCIAMDPHVVAELTKLKDDKQMPINTKWAKLKETMVQAGLAWPRTEVPSQVLCHPTNRAGIMLNAWDVHAKGAKMLELGIAMNKIQESVAFEVSTKGSTKQQQLQANIQLVESSHNQLAPVTGQERLLSCSSSHLVAFCKAVLHGCQTQEPSLKAKTNGQLSLAALANSQDGLVTMCEQGWTWLVVSSLVEEAFPDLPTLVQQALNTT